MIYAQPQQPKRQTQKCQQIQEPEPKPMEKKLLFVLKKSSMLVNHQITTIIKMMTSVGSKLMAKAYRRKSPLLLFIILLTSMIRATKTTSTPTTTPTTRGIESLAGLQSTLDVFYAHHLNNAQYVNTQREAAVTTTTAANSSSIDKDLLLVHKCCSEFEIIVNNFCTPVNESAFFKPKFKTYSGEDFVPPKYQFIYDVPNCGSMQTWRIFDDEGSSDKLVLLSDGKLRHYTNSDNEDANKHMLDAYDNPLDDDYKTPHFYDYALDQYCIDKAISTEGEPPLFRYAKVCLNKKDVKWTDTGFLIHKILNPIFHVINLILLLVIAIIYFILPTLRDLVGNMVTTIAVCLMIGQAADIARIFTEFSSHVSFVIADIVMCFSLLGAFFWLNANAYYIWKMFRSRNVFLRVTDGRKYCYYSVYVWGSTGIIAIMAVFAHFFLDVDTYQRQRLSDDQDNIGWLGLAIFFAPIACTIIVDLFFYVTTLKLINRRNVYGRIQHKLKVNFIMYSLMLLVMSICWLFLILSWLNFEGLLYANILVNALQGPLLLHVCVLRQKHITFLLKKSCCYNEPPSTSDWGDEMHYMNGNDY